MARVHTHTHTHTLSLSLSPAPGARARVHAPVVGWERRSGTAGAAGSEKKSAGAPRVVTSPSFATPTHVISHRRCASFQPSGADAVRCGHAVGGEVGHVQWRPATVGGPQAANVIVMEARTETRQRSHLYSWPYNNNICRWGDRAPTRQGTLAQRQRGAASYKS
jgi:hypothetical protein